MKAPKVKQPTVEPVVPLPDMTDAVIRKQRADALAGLLKNRGRSSTIFSQKGGAGQISDQGGSRTIKATVQRGAY